MKEVYVPYDNGGHWIEDQVKMLNHISKFIIQRFNLSRERLSFGWGKAAGHKISA